VLVTNIKIQDYNRFAANISSCNSANNTNETDTNESKITITSKRQTNSDSVSNLANNIKSDWSVSRSIIDRLITAASHKVLKAELFCSRGIL